MSNWGFVEWWTACLIALNVWERKNRQLEIACEYIATIASQPCRESFHRLGGIDDCDPCLARKTLEDMEAVK